jgi:metal-responsive CopG/Arc/MetJ family transcriptional regulator
MAATSAFTIRIPRKLLEQIDARTQFSRRSRNAEITVLLEGSLDKAADSVTQQRALIKASEERVIPAPE